MDVDLQAEARDQSDVMALPGTTGMYDRSWQDENEKTTETHRTARDGEAVHPVFCHHSRARVVLRKPQTSEQGDANRVSHLSVFELTTQIDFFQNKVRVRDDARK